MLTNQPVLTKTGIQVVIIAVLLTVAMIFIGLFSHHSASQLLRQQFYSQGVSLTNSMNDSIWLKPHYKTAIGSEHIPTKNDYQNLDVEIKRKMDGTPVLKLKVYDSKGTMKYSSNQKDMMFGDGDDLLVVGRTNLVALDVVNKKRPMGDYEFRSVFDDGKVEHKDRYIMSVYLPVRMNDGEIGRVVEVYYDVTDIISRFNEDRDRLRFVLAATWLALLLLIGFLINRAEKESQYKLEQREKYLNLIKYKNRDLIRKTKELKKIKERAEKMVDEKSTFLSRMSHELRTPMNAVIGLADLIMRTSLTDKQKGYINAIQSSGNILLDITDEILTIGRLETGYLEIKNDAFSISDVIENVIDVMGNRASRKGLDLLCDFNPDMNRRVTGDPVRLRQILMNLVANAIKYTEHGNVTIQVKHHKGNFGAEHYHFEVADSGIGIDEEDQKKIFAAYCHLTRNLATRENSTGLGLAICKRLVEVMNGAIGLRSQPGIGSVFWFKLPLHTEPVATNSETDEFTMPAGSRLLVVTENEGSGNNILGIISSLGLHADLVHSYDAAKDCIERSFITLAPYSMFLVDAEVGGKCGLDFCKHIRSYAALDKARILIMVPISLPLARGVISNISNTICINKPIQPSRLLMVVKAAHTPKHLTALTSVTRPETNEVLKNQYNLLTTPTRILVAEDNPVNRELLSEMLSELKITYKTVENGHGALNALMEQHYDLVMLDCRLPDLDGHEVASRIRNMSVKQKQPVIIITSSDNSLKTQQLCLESGVDGFLHKPITLGDLSASLSAWLPLNELSKPDDDKTRDSTVINIFSAPIIDAKIVNGFRNRDKGNPGFMRRLYGIFIDDCFERLDVLKQQLADADFNAMSKTVHSIKSGCEHVGAKRMAKYCDVLGNMVRNQSHHETACALQHFTEEFDRVIIALSSEIETESLV